MNVTFAVRALKSGAGVRESEILMKRGSNVSFKRYLSQNYMCIVISRLGTHDPSKEASIKSDHIMRSTKRRRAGLIHALINLILIRFKNHTVKTKHLLPLLNPKQLNKSKFISRNSVFRFIP